ncbi:MAG TPA: hypothetical protein VGG66_11940, partial [Rhizomicrobium sp.]
MHDLSRGHLAQIYGSATGSEEVIEAFFAAPIDDITGIMVTEASTYSAVQKRLNGARSSWRNRIAFFDADTALSQFMLPGGFDSNRAAKYLGQVIRDA